MNNVKIGVLGTGTWGIALIRLLANKGYDVTAWSAIESEIDYLNEKHTHPKLPGMELSEAIVFTKNIEDSVLDMDMVVFAVPSIFIRSTAKQVAEILSGKSEGSRTLPLMVTVAKGIEKGTSYTMAQVIHDEFKAAGFVREGASEGDDELSAAKVIGLSGPTHAEEVAFDLPTTIVSACEDEKAAERVQEIFMTPVFRVYTNTDIDGVEICGAMKNVIALAVGIAKGIGVGDNAKAALITRGMEEIRRLGAAMGCKDHTFAGLAGIGDLIVTSMSEHSRNNRCGQLIGEGYSAEEAVEKVGMVVEGLNALPSIMELSKKYGVDVPISSALDSIVSLGKDPKEAAKELMNRSRKKEF